MKIKIINEIKERINIEWAQDEQRVLEINGEFGPGKTTFITNEEVWKNIFDKKDKKFINYINLLEVDFQ